jgi:hypothetical protein
MLQISAYPLVEVDHLASVDARVDVADRAADRATEVCVDIAPVPVRRGLLRRFSRPACPRAARSASGRYAGHGRDAAADASGTL